LDETAMTPVLEVALLWLLFGGSHLALAAAPIREPLVRRLGSLGFLLVYVLVALAGFSMLVGVYARAKSVGPPGLDLAAYSPARALLGSAVLFGTTFVVGGLAPSAYWESPTAVLSEGVQPPRGLGRVTRHPMFSGLAIMMGAHALLASRLTGSVFFGGFVLLAIFGPIHQARKLRKKHGPALDAYFRQTSAVPFVAILQGRQRLVLRELPWKTLALGVAIAFGLQRVHDGILAYQGALVSAVVASASSVIGVVSIRRSARRRA
jgi:uncharacterized membrane protein